MMERTSDGKIEAPPRLRIGIVVVDPLRVQGMIALFAEFAELLPMTPTDAIRDTALDMVLIDADENLFALMQAYRRARAGLRLMVLGTNSDSRYIGQVVAAGAKGYLTHTASAKEIRMAIEVVADGSIWAPRKVLASLIDTYSPREQAVAKSDIVFTARERDILQLLVGGRPDREIGNALGLSHRTIQAAVSRMLRKSGVENRVALTVLALRQSSL